ncbi:MAG: type II toxin-antitoxin system HicA family toxin [Candidatus Rokubacteria bacterium]|nr:type II toxin-antitoxin system HicA family toxin [Candidatus Rokubacteria bacterium]
MTYSELTRKLRALGCVLKRQARGSHEIWHNPRANRSAVIPNHPGDIPIGTLRAVLKQLEIAREELDRG